MKRLLTPLVLLVLLLAACGDDTTEVGTASGDAADAPTASESDVDGSDSDGAELLPEAIPDIQEPADMDEHVITDVDMVDPKVTTPGEVVVNPDDPAQLWVRFVGGDPNCTAAEAIVLVETPDEVSIELMTGITQDALTRSCVADEFNLRVDVSLREDASGKSITWAQAAGDDPQLVTPDLSTDDFIGLSEADAGALADENSIPWRITRIDDEHRIVTMDYSPSRLNFELDDGVVTVVTLG